MILNKADSKRINKHESGYEASIKKMPFRIGDSINHYESMIRESLDQCLQTRGISIRNLYRIRLGFLLPSLLAT